MQLKWLAIPIISACAVLSYAPVASATSLMPFDEPTAQLVSPSPSISSWLYGQVTGSTQVAQNMVTSTPLLCSNTSAPANPSTPVNPIYYSPSGQTSLKPFVFGGAPATPTVPAIALGASVVYGGAMQMGGDPSLVCYGLDANGVHGPTPGGVMRDEFEGVNYSPTMKADFNSSVVLSVFHVPTSASDFYGYTIDVSIAAAPGSANCASNDCNFSLLEGFDTSVFATNSSATHPDEGWCIGSAGSTACSTSTVEGGININYSTWPNSFLPHLTAGAAPQSYRFVVKRYFATNVTTLPASNAPLAIAALFSPFDMDENFIGDNVSAGYANTAPAVVQTDGTWTTFSGKVGALAENTDSGALTFNITDADTAEGTNKLTAAVTLNLSGLQVPVTPTCTLTSNPNGQAPVTRQCTIDVNFADPNWWNASVDAAYRGQGNLFATDPGNVGATASIVATDAALKSSVAVNVPIHVQSTANSVPVAAFGAAMPGTPDPNQGGTSFPTYSCSVAANNCGGTFNVVELDGLISALPGPPAAFDELASQTVDVNGIVCGQSGEQDAIFVNQPVAVLSTPTSLDLLFQLKTPLVTGSSLCTVTITDKMAAFPAGESAQVTGKHFRIVVNP